MVTEFAIHRYSPKLRIAALFATLALGLSACGGPAEPNTSGNVISLPPDATKEEYQEAFADIEPITLNTQTGGPEGSRLSIFLEKYFDSVEDWSDGKITFSVDYANAVASPTEADKAVMDGTLDMAGALPTYDPDKYPALNSIINLSFHSSQSPLVGPLQLTGWLTEHTASSPEVAQEYEAQGLYPLVPLYHAGLDALLCTEPRTTLSDFEGTTSRAAARAHTSQLASIGIDSVSLD